MVASTNELANELVNKKTTNILKISSGCESIKCSLEWSRKCESIFSTTSFLVQQILKIMGFQIGIIGDCGSLN